MQPVIKTLLIILYCIFLTGCDADNSANRKVNEESEMFVKPTTENYVIFSPLEGVLMRNGQPLANTKIIRRLRWNGNDEGLMEEFTTDDQGRFSLPVHEEALSLGMLGQFVSSTKLEVDIGGQILDVWYNNKFEEGLYAETNGPITDLVCDLDFEEIVIKAGLSKIMTICQWKDMPESE
jgi:hypothetical protein